MNKDLENLDKFGYLETKQDVPAFMAKSPDANIRTWRK